MLLITYSLLFLQYNGFSLINEPVMKILMLVLISLVYIFLCTQIFEYTINEASNTWLTVAGVIALIVLSYFYFKYLIRNLKKLNS